MGTKGHRRTLVALACLAAAIAVAGAGTPVIEDRAFQLVRDGWTAVVAGHAPIGPGGADRDVLYLVSNPNDVFAVALFDAFARVHVIQSFDWHVLAATGAPVMPLGISFSDDPLAVWVWDHNRTTVADAFVAHLYRWENGFLRYAESSDYIRLALPRIETKCTRAADFVFWIDESGVLHSADARRHACES